MSEGGDQGEDHLRRITWTMIGLALLGIVLWGTLRSWTAALVFAVGSLTSLACWTLVLRGMMGRYPAEALPLAMGVILFVAGILLEALRLAFQKPDATPPD